MPKSITARTLGLSLATVASLTLLGHATNSAVFFFLLYPGFALSLLATGGHGGTQSSNGAASVAGFVVNAAVYAVLFAIVFALRRRMRA
jgi:hypothetical protein